MGKFILLQAKLWHEDLGAILWGQFLDKNIQPHSMYRGVAYHIEAVYSHTLVPGDKYLKQIYTVDCQLSESF